MKLYDVLKKNVREGIRYNDETYDVDFEKDLVGDIIRFGDRLSTKKDEYGNIVMIGVPVEKSEHKNKLLNDIKKTSNLNPSVMSFIIDKVVNNLTDYVDINNFDYIVSPKSSSPLIHSLINKLKTVSNKPIFITDMFLKNDIENIWLDIEEAKKELEPKHLKSLLKSFERAKKVDGQSMKLQRLGKYHRKYVKNMLIVNPQHNNILVDMLDKNILVVDDLITTGKTLNDIRVILSNLGSGEVTLFTMFG